MRNDGFRSRRPLVFCAFALLAAACGKADFGGDSATKKRKPPPRGRKGPLPPATTETSTPSQTQTETEGGTDTDPETPVTEPCKPKNDRPIAGLTVGLDKATGVLTLTGDGQANTWTLVGTDVKGEVSLKENPSATPVIFLCAKSLHVIGNAGDDVFDLGGIQGLTLVTIDGNEGNDVITLIEVGKADGAKLVMNGGAGDDTMSVNAGTGYTDVLANGG